MSKGGARAGAGRKRKNDQKRHINFRPSNEALAVYDSWQNKSETLDKAIINYNLNEK